MHQGHGGGREVESTIWRSGKDKERGKKKGSVEERRKEKSGESQPLLSTHLKLPAGPGDADSTVSLIHPPSPTSCLVFSSQSLSLLPFCPSSVRDALHPLVLWYDLEKTDDAA